MTYTASLSHLRTFLPESSSRPLPALRPITQLSPYLTQNPCISGLRRRASERPRSVARQTSSVGSGRGREGGRKRAGGRGLTFELRERRSRREGRGKKRRPDLPNPAAVFAVHSLSAKKGALFSVGLLLRKSRGMERIIHDSRGNG